MLNLTNSRLDELSWLLKLLMIKTAEVPFLLIFRVTSRLVASETGCKELVRFSGDSQFRCMTVTTAARLLF